MERRSDEIVTEEMTSGKTGNRVTHNRSLARQPRYLLVSWILLLLLGGLFLFAAISDLVADARTGLPTDHMGTFHNVTGIAWSSAQQTTSGITHYVTLLETAYAVHELVFGLLFLIIVAIPFQRRARWAWWACWVPMLANVTYSLTFGRYDSTTLVYSLIADIALPVLLLIHMPAFFGKSAQHSVTS